MMVALIDGLGEGDFDGAIRAAPLHDFSDEEYAALDLLDLAEVSDGTVKRERAGLPAGWSGAPISGIGPPGGAIGFGPPPPIGGVHRRGGGSAWG